MHVALLVLVCTVSILIIATGAKQPCRTWPTYGLCPFQPIPGDFSTLFDTTVGKDCKDGNASERFVPCLFSAGFSCVMAFLNSSEIVAGCIRDIGSKLVKFERSPDNPRTVKIVDQEFALIRRSCGPPKNCSLAEVSIFNRSMILNVCCCKGEHCVKQKSYENKLIYDFEMKTEEEDLPFHDICQLYILAICYATTFTAITINLWLYLYGVYCNDVIIKNR